MRSLTKTCVSGIAAFALLLVIGCCGNNDNSTAQRTRAPEPGLEPVAVAPAPTPAPQPETYSERAGIKVSMLPLSSPPAPTSPPPRQTFAEAPPAYYPPPAPASYPPPAPVYSLLPRPIIRPQFCVCFQLYMQRHTQIFFNFDVCCTLSFCYWTN